jgi:hypothetical protein
MFEILTWTNAVDMITPVPNCFNIVKTMLFRVIFVNLWRRMGENTAECH